MKKISIGVIGVAMFPLVALAIVGGVSLCSAWAIDPNFNLDWEVDRGAERESIREAQTPLSAIEPTPVPTPTPTITPTSLPNPSPSTLWPPYTGTIVPDGEPVACYIHSSRNIWPPHPDHFIHWATTDKGEYLALDYRQGYRGYLGSESVFKVSLQTETVEPIINASPYRWRMSLYAHLSPSEPLIAYTSCEFVTNYTSNHDTEIATIDWVTGAHRRLTDNASYDFFPVWSPNGEHIAFLSWLGAIGGNLWNFASESVAINVINGQGDLKTSGRGALLHPVAWSPNSEEFAFIKEIEVSAERLPSGRGPIMTIGIFLTGIDAIESEQIASATSYELSNIDRLNSIIFGGPSWSPDGQEIAFGSSDDEGASVHLVSREGTNHRVIWEGESSKPVSQVEWSPDGEEILFIADSARIIRPDGGGLRQLELPSEIIIDAQFSTVRAAWSPDSSRLAFYNGMNAVVIMNRDGTNPRILEVR